MDFAIYRALNGFAARHDAFEDPLRFFGAHAELSFVALLAALFLATGKWRSPNGRHGVVAAGFSGLFALGVAQAMADLWDRVRPYDAHPGGAHLFVAPSSDPSFPSDHATAAFAIAVSIWLRNRRAGALALAMATAVMLSRVVVGVHYPSDVIGGAAVGTASALIFWLPPVRRPLRALAEWAGGRYERILDRVLRRQPATT
jgi:undecaprenyl-diphosphatase